MYWEIQMSIQFNIEKTFSDNVFLKWNYQFFL